MGQFDNIQTMRLGSSARGERHRLVGGAAAPPAMTPPAAMSERTRRRAAAEGGFTLVELMVVLMILAILLAIIVPSYLGARERSQDRATQVNLYNALVAAKVAYTDYASYGPLVNDTSGPLTTESLVIRGGGTTGSTTVNRSAWHRARAVEPRVGWLWKPATALPGGTVFEDGGGVAASNDAHEISFQAGKDTDESVPNYIWLAAMSDTDACWVIFDDDEAGTWYGHIDLDGVTTARLRTGCDATAFDTAARRDAIRASQGGYTSYVQLGTTAPNFRALCMYPFDAFRPIYRTPGIYADNTTSSGQTTVPAAQFNNDCPPVGPLPRS